MFVGRVPELRDHVDAASFDFSGVRVFVFVDHVLMRRKGEIGDKSQVKKSKGP